MFPKGCYLLPIIATTTFFFFYLTLFWLWVSAQVSFNFIHSIFLTKFLECSFRWQRNCQLQKALSILQTPKQHFPSYSACQEKDFTSPWALHLIRIGRLQCKLALRPAKNSNYIQIILLLTIKKSKCRQFPIFRLILYSDKWIG